MSIAGSIVDNNNRRRAEQNKFLNSKGIAIEREKAESQLLKEYEKAIEIVTPLSPEYEDLRRKIDLFYEDREKWRLENASELGRYSPGAMARKIAPMMAYRMADLANPQGANVIVPMAAIYSKSQFPEIDEKMVELYSGLNVRSFSKTFTYGKSRNTTGMEFIYQGVSNFTKGSPYQAIQAIENIKKNAGRAVVWDLETFGRHGEGGYDSAQRITEFSFSDGTGNFKTGEFNIKKTYGSIIGLSEKEHKQMMQLIDKFSRNEELSEGELVTLNRLALHGAEQTRVDWDNAKDGVVRFSSFAEQKDITGANGTLEQMHRGADLLREVGAYQEKTRVGNDMFGWEKELTAALRNIIGNDLTAISHNGNRFDIPQLDFLLHNKEMTTAAFRQEVTNILSEGHLSFKHNLDTIVPLRENMGNSYHFWTKYLGGDRKKIDTFMRWMNEQGETPKTQQTILAAMAIKQGIAPEEIHHGQAHIAESDAIDAGHIVFGSNLFDPDSPTSMISAGKTKQALKLKANSTQLFYAKNSSWNPQTRGLVSFTFDKETEQWGSSDGIVADKNGETRALYQIPGVRRRGMYTLSGMDKVSSDSPLMNMLAGHKNLAGGDLYSVRWTPYSDSKRAAAQRDVVWVGTYKDIMDNIDNMMIHVASKKNANSKRFSMEGVAQENLDALSTVTIDANGNRVRKTANLQTLKEISTRTFDDPAGRIARDKNIVRDAHLLAYINRMDTYVAAQLAETGLTTNQVDATTIENLRQGFRDMVKNRTHAVYMEHLNTGKSYDELDISDTLVNFFGYRDKKTGELKAFADSMENSASLEKWGRNNYKLISTALTAVRDKYGDNVKYSDPKAKFFYKQVREMLEDAAVAKVGKSGAGYNVLPRVMGELDKFQVDIEGFYGVTSRTGSTIVSLDMNSEYKMADQLLRAMGHSQEAIAKKKKDEKTVLLKNFQKFLFDKKILKLKDMSVGKGAYDKNYLVNSETDSPTIAASKISYLMQQRRRHNVMAGILSTTDQFDIINTLDNAGLADDEIMAVKERAQGINFELAESFKPVYDKNGNPIWRKDSGEGKKFYEWVDRVAGDINRGIVFNNGFNVSEGSAEEEAEFVKKLVDTAGYSPEDARKVYKMQRARFAASHNMLKNVVAGIYTHGGALGYNIKNGQFWVYNTAEDLKAGNYTVVGLDHNVWNNGSFRRRLANGQEFADEVGIYHSDKMDGLIYSTEEGLFAKDGENLTTWFMKKGKESGNLAEGVSRTLGAVRERYRQHSADYYGDRADRTLSNVFNINDYLLGTLDNNQREELIQKLEEEGTQAGNIMADFFKNPSKEKAALKEASSSLAAAALQTMHITAPYILNSVKEGRAEMLNLLGDNLESVLQAVESHGGDTRGQVNILSDAGRGLMAYDKDLNHISKKMDRALPFNLERAQKIMAGRGARFGAAFQSMQEHMHMNAISEELGYNLADTMIVNKLSASSEDMRKLMKHAADILGVDSYEYAQMMTIFTDEASGAISAFAADAGLEAEHYEQHVAFGRVARSDIENNRNFKKFLDASSTIVFDDNGKAHFKSSAGVYVQANEALFTKASNSATYEDEIIRAKQDGLLKSGIYRNGHKMTDEAVSEYINKHLDPSLTGDAREEAAWALFTKENSPFTHDFYVESLDIAGHAKMADYSEKQMSHVLMNGLGKGSHEVDQKIASTLKELGADALIGRQVHYSIIEELMEKGSVQGTSFAAYVHGMAIAKAVREKDENKRKQLLAITDSQIEEILTKNFGGVSSFAAALEEERYRTSQAMDVSLKAMGIEEVIDEFGMTAAGHWKHGGPSPFEAVFNALIDYKDLTHEQAKDVLEKSGAVKGIVVHTDKNGQKWAEFKTEGSSLDIRALNKVAEEYFGGKNGWHDSMHELETKNGKVMFEVSRSQAKALPNYNVGKSGNTSTFKADERTIDALKTSVYTKAYLDKSSDAIDQAFGDTAFTQSIKAYNETKKDGDIANQTLLHDFMKNAYVYGDNPDEIQGAYRMLKDGKKTSETKAGTAWLKEQGANEKAIQHIANALQKANIENVTANKMLTLIEADSAATAHTYNQSHKFTNAEMSEAGFNFLSIDELRTNARLQHRSEDSFLQSLYGQAIVLDLHSDILGKNGQVYSSDEERKIALPFSALQAEDKTGATRKSEIQRAVSQIANLMNEYEDGYESNRNNDDANEKIREKITGKIKDLRTLIAKHATDKKGVIKSASTAIITDGTMYGTAHGYEFMGQGLDGALGEAHFLDSGKSFTELADARNAARAAQKAEADVGFLFASAYHRDVIYSDEMFEKITDGDKKLAAQLKQRTFGVLNREGTIGVNQRYPLVSRDAVLPVNVHFSDHLGRDEFRANFKTWKQENGDSDSDKMSAMIRKSKAEITLGDNKTVHMDVDYATYRAIDSTDGMSIKLLDDNFIEAKASMIRNAIDITPHAQPQLSHWGKDNGIADDTYGVSNLKEYTYDGHRLVNYNQHYTNDEKAANKQLIDNLEKHYKDLHAEEFAKMQEDEALYVENMGNFVAQNYEGEEASRFDEALHYRKWEMGITERMNEAVSKKAAGIMNKSLFELSRIANGQMELTGKQTGLVNIGVMALQEGTLTGKNEHGELDLEKAKKLQKIWNNAMHAMYTGEKREEAAVALENFSRTIFEERKKKEFGPRSAMLGTTEELLEETPKLFGDIVRNVTIDKKQQKAMMIAISSTGLKASDSLSYSSSAAADSMVNQTAQILNYAHEDAGIVASFDDIDATPEAKMKEMAKDAKARILESMANSRNIRYRRAAEEATKSVTKHSVGIAPMGGGLGSKVIAASVGIAAGLMTAGYAAGPSIKHDVPTPAQTQAMQMSNDQGDQINMQQMSLSDSNLNVMRGGPDTGYIININAQTSQGQQAAVDAISNAASGMVPQSGSVNVNLSTSMTNPLSQLQVNRMVAHAVGIA